MKVEVMSKLFEGKNIRTVWDKDKEEFYFSVVDIVFALTDSPRPRKYWSDLKNKLAEEDSQLSEKIGQLKMKASDGKSELYEKIVRLKMTAQVAKQGGGAKKVAKIDLENKLGEKLLGKKYV